MRLKVLIVPFLVVMILILLIGYIQPDVKAIQAKKLVLAAKAEQVVKMETVINNIDALNSALDTQRESEQFVSRYLPKTMDQGRAIDSLNFLAAQSGLLITGLDLKQPAKEAVSADEETEKTVSGDGSVAAAPSFKPPVAKTYAVSVSVIGSYENLKGFFDHISHMDRFHKLTSFEIAKKEKKDAAAPESTADTGELTGMFQADFDYLPERSAKAVLTAPVFQSSTLDLSVAGEASNRVANPVPELEKPQTGRPNPFQ